MVSSLMYPKRQKNDATMGFQPGNTLSKYEYIKLNSLIT